MVAPGAIDTLAPTVAAGSELESETVEPDGGAGFVNETVPVTTDPATAVEGDNAMPARMGPMTSRLTVRSMPSAEAVIETGERTSTGAVLIVTAADV